MSALLWAWSAAWAQTCVVLESGDAELDRDIIAVLDALAYSKTDGCGVVVRTPQAEVPDGCGWSGECLVALAAEQRLALIVAGRLERVADEPWVRLHVLDASGPKILGNPILEEDVVQDAAITGAVWPLLQAAVLIDVAQIRQAEELDNVAIAVPKTPEKPEVEVTASRGSWHIALGASQWHDAGLDLAVTLSPHLTELISLQLELGSQLVRILPSDGPGAVGVALPQASLGLAVEPPVAGSLRPRAGFDLLSILYTTAPVAMAPGFRLRAGVDAVAGKVGLGLEGYAGAAVAPFLAQLDPREQSMTALFGVRAGPVVRW